MLNNLKKRPKEFSILPDSRDLLPACFFLLTGLFFLMAFFLGFIAFRLNAIADRKTTFVQLINGQTATVTEEQYLYRHPEVVKNVVREWANLTFNWDGTVEGTDRLDKGRKIGDNSSSRVTTDAYFASFLIEAGDSGFRQEFLKELAKITPPQVFAGRLQSKLLISFLSAPRQTRPGEWQVDLVATRILVDLQGGDEEIPFNRTLTLRAADIPAPPSPDASALEKQIYQIRAAGLEIAKISNLEIGS